VKNLEILVRDKDTLREYEGQVNLDPTYSEKLTEWIQKRRYNLIEQAKEDQMLLKVDIFSFPLTLKKDDSAQKILEELSVVKKERSDIMRDIKLFNFFFYNVFNDADYSKRLRMNETFTQLEKSIENPSSLFVIKSAKAV